MLRPGEVLDGKYAVVREVGAGAMGVIYVARHVALGRHVAVKALRPELGADAELAARFEQEAKAASAIGHPHIVDVFDLGRTPAGAMYMVMELLTGRSLRTLLEEEGLLEATRAIELMDQVLSALGAAHKHGIVHRDLKPENIFVVETEARPSFVKLLDFGISKVLSGPGESTRGTLAGMIMGTPEYMSPEQATGDVARIDHRTDVYAAGVVLYEMVLGRTPFHGPSHPAILAALLKAEYIKPSALRADLPSGLEEVIVTALHFHREHRWASAEAMRENLRFSADPVLEIPETATLVSPPEPEPMPVPEPMLMPEPAPAPAPPAAPASPPPSPSAFAPPADDGPALALELELDPRPPARRPSAKSLPAVELAPRPRGGATMAEDLAPPRTSLRRFLLYLLAAPLLAGAVMAARALMPAQSAATALRAGVAFKVVPAEAVLRLDGQPVSGPSVELALDSSHTLEASAPGRIAKHRRFTVTDVALVAVRLPHALAPLSVDDPPAMPAELEGPRPEPQDAAQVEAALAELARIEPCLVDDPPLDCPGALAQARATPPDMPGLDGALAELLPSFADAAAVPAPLAARARAELLTARALWEEAELDLIEREDGAYAGWHLRRVVLAARALVRAVGSPNASDAQRKARLRAFDDARTALRAHEAQYPDDLKGTPGAERFGAAADAFAALARRTPRAKSAKELAPLVEAQARLVDVLNSCVLR